MKATNLRAVLLLTASTGSLTFLAASAHAAAPMEQADGAQVGPGDQAMLPNASSAGDVVVTGTRAALQNAERTKRDSDTVIDGISADDIGNLPDISIADSLVRIPGLTANDTEDGFGQVSVRGLGPDLTNTTYNGRVVPTTNANDRRVQLGDLPSEGIGAAYIQKTVTASTIEGGLGGTIDIRSVAPLETKRKGLSLVARGQIDDVNRSVHGVYGFKPVDMRAEASYVGHITDNLAVAATYAYFRATNISPSTQLDAYRTVKGTALINGVSRSDPNGDGVTDAYAANAGNNIGAGNEQRHSALGMIQWRPVSALTVSLDGYYVWDNRDGRATRFFAFGMGGDALPAPTSATVANNTVVQFNGTAAGYRILEGAGKTFDRQMESGLNLNFDNGGPVKFVFDVARSRATERTAGSQLTAENAAANAAGQRIGFGYDVTDPDNVQFNFQSLTPEQYAVSNISAGTARRSAQITAVRADFNIDPGLSFLRDIQVGAKFDARDKENAPDDLDYQFTAVGTRPRLDSSYLTSTSNTFANVAKYLGGASSASFPLYDVARVAQAFTTASGVTVNAHLPSDIANRSKVEENTYALYAQANLRIGKLTGNAGGRFVLTDERISGFVGTTLENMVPQQVGHSYSYFLPALNLKYEITPKLITRFAVSKSLSRPEFGLLKIGSAIDPTTLQDNAVINRGNPDLMPYLGKNLDATLEWYPRHGMSFTLQGFYKWVSNFIIDQQLADTIEIDGREVPVTINSQINDPSTLHFKGIEASARVDFDFLPGPLSHLGTRLDLSRNWTTAYANFSSVVSYNPATGVQLADGASTVRVTPNNFNPLIYGAQLYYSTHAVDLRLAYRYYQRYTREVNNAYQIHPGGQVDLTGSWTLTRNFRLLGSIRNLTQTKSERYFVDVRSPSLPYIYQRTLYDGRVFSLGVRANF